MKAATQELPQPGEVLDRRYRLIEAIDGGGMGMIMRAEHTRMGREVAVKLLRAEIAAQDGYRARFEREAKLATTLEHPNVIQCFDYGETPQGVLFLVMELLDGNSLRRVVKQEGRLSTARVRALAEQLLDGMAAAHRLGIIHRDLKPANLFVCLDYRGRELLKILDFGIARTLHDDEIRLTKTGAIVGTASYLAPEALIFQQPGTRGDVYAIGLILLEALIGRKVFGADTMTQTFLQQLVVPAPIPRRVWDTPFGQILRCALEKDPARRYADAEEMFSALSAIEGEFPDFRLSPHELPPAIEEAISGGLLDDLGAGRFTDPATLAKLPSPVPYDVATQSNWAEKETIRIVIEQITGETPPYPLGPEPHGTEETDTDVEFAPATTPDVAPIASKQPVEEPATIRGFYVVGLLALACVIALAFILWPVERNPESTLPLPEPVAAVSTAPVAPRDLPGIQAAPQALDIGPPEPTTDMGTPRPPDASDLAVLQEAKPRRPRARRARTRKPVDAGVPKETASSPADDPNPMKWPVQSDERPKQDLKRFLVR